MIFQRICLIFVSFFVLSEGKRLSENDAIEWLKFVRRCPEIQLIHNNFNNLALPFDLNNDNSQRNAYSDTVGSLDEFRMALWENETADLVQLFKEFMANNTSLWMPEHKCGNDILYMIFNIKEMWAIQMLDASGKPPAGILRGGTTWLGNSKECQEVFVPGKAIGDVHFGDFSGHQCLVQWNLNLTLILKTQMSFKTGICVPDSCSSEHLKNNTDKLRQLLNTNEIPVENPSNQFIAITDIDCSDHARSWTGADIAYMCLLALLCAFVFAGTVCDIENNIRSKKLYISLENENEENNYNQYDNVAYTINEEESAVQNVAVAAIKEEEYKDQVPISTHVEKKSDHSKPKTIGSFKEFLICFSLYTNGAKLLSVRNQKGQLDCLHGIRFLSMSWVILGHTFLFPMNVADNPIDVIEYLLNSFSFQAVYQGTFSVDTFFFLSGFLLAYLFLKEYGKSDKTVNWIYYYVHRIWRLSPAFFMLLGFYTTLWLHLGSGPLWPTKTDGGNCDKYWWWDILYILNFQKNSNMCMAWAWYLANDMQFYIISPLFLIFLWKLPIVGNLLVGIAMISSWVVTCVISANDNFELLFGNTEGGRSPQEFLQKASRLANMFDDIYSKPYCRIGPYLVGILFGYALYKTNGRQKFMKWWMSVIGWLVALFLVSIVIMGTYHSSMGNATYAAYNGLSRSAWGIGVGWIVFACLTGSGGPFNTMLSWKFWVPLSRLTYCAYLVHPMIMNWYTLSLQSTFHFEVSTIVIYYLGFLVASYLAAFVASLVLESPMMALEKFILKRFSKN